MIPKGLIDPEQLRKRVLQIACFISLFVVCSALGRPWLNPFVPLELDDPSVVSGNSHGIVVVDKSSRRLLFATPQQQLVEVVHIDRGEVPVDEIVDIALRDDVVYVAGVRRSTDGESVASEAVLAYGMDGRLRDVLWETSYGNDEFHPTPVVVDIAPDETGVVLACLDGWGSTARNVRLVRVDDDANETELRSISTEESILDACYNYVTDSCLFISVTGDVLSETAENGTEHLLPAGSTTRYNEVDASGQLAVVLNAVRAELLFVSDLDGEATVEQLKLGYTPNAIKLVEDEVFAALENGALWRQNLKSHVTSQTTTFELVPALALRFLAVSLCQLFLTLYLGTSAIRLLLRRFAEGRHNEVERVVISLAIGLLFVIAGGFYSVASLREALDTRREELQQMASFLSFMSTEQLGDCAAREAERMAQKVTPDDGPDYRALSHAANGLMLTGERSGIGVACRIYVVSQDDDRVRVLLSSKNDAVFGEDINDTVLRAMVRKVCKAGTAVSDDDLELSDIVLASTSSGMHAAVREYEVVALAPLFDSSGNCQAVVEVSSNMLSLIREQALGIIDTILTFLLVAVGVYLLIDEEFESGRAIMRYRELKREGVPWAHALMSRPLAFVCGLASSMDVALAVVMVNSLVLANGDTPSASLLAAPIMAATLGQTIAPTVNTLLSRRFSKRGTTLLSVIPAILGQLLCFVAVLNHWFEPFLLGKFVMSAGYAITLASITNDTLLAKGDDKSLASSAISAGTPSGIVAGILGGLVALVGSELIYAVSAIFGAVLLGMCLYVMPKERPSQEGASQGSGNSAKAERHALAKKTTKFFLSPPMIATLLFGMVPLAISGGYHTYVFPLFMSASHLTHAQLANLYVLSQVIVYAARDALTTFKNSHNHWNLTWLSFVGLGVSFALFAKNQSVVWAIVAIVVISVLRWYAGNCKAIATKWASKLFGMSAEEASRVMNSATMAVGNTQSIAMGAFLSLGAEAGCLALGAYLAACGVLYALGTRKQVKATEEAAS